MKYAVLYDPKSEKQLDKLPKELAQRVILKMRLVGETGQGIETIKDEQYGFKVRVGDYRILIDITYNPATIWVRYINHRSRVYKRI